jgi:hypothetical protein
MKIAQKYHKIDFNQYHYNKSTITTTTTINNNTITRINNN